MSNTSRRLRMAVLIVLAYAVIVAVWAARPLSESIAVGTDWTPTLLDPPQSERSVRVDVSCNSLFSSSPRPDEPLPVLTPQPEGKPPLAFGREPCAFVHDDARKALVINVAVIGGALVALVIITRRRRPATVTA